LRAFETIAHRNNGFSPWVMITTAKIDLTKGDKTHRMAAVFKRAKVAIWTLPEDPLIEATINQPLELLVKAVAAKINLVLFNDHLSDETVARLIAEIRENLDNEDVA
jgi:nickel-dependent lactate racemase